ncbi:MAG: flagellin [Lachnospiraceae bacterium]|nr:flagellin [Lachnospiraceae bacterium]
MRISYNAQAMAANTHLNIANAKVSTSTERLSSGKKINSAKDAPSGFSIAKRTALQIRGLSASMDAVSTGSDVASTADSALGEIHDMLQRMNELAVKAANDTLSKEDRDYCQTEIEELKKEITRISEDTDFNGEHLLDGRFGKHAYVNSNSAQDSAAAGENKAAKVEFVDSQVQVGKYKAEFSLGTKSNSDGTMDIDEDSTTVTMMYDSDGDGTYDAEVKDIKVVKTDNQYVTSNSGDEKERKTVQTALTINTADGGEYTFSFGSDFTSGTLEFEVADLGPMAVQAGANKDQLIEIEIPKMSLLTLGVAGVNVSTYDDNGATNAAGASKAIEDIKYAIDYVSKTRATVGAQQNRLEHSASSLSATHEAMVNALSTLEDTDMATETTEHSTQQILMQAATSVLAQANDRPSEVLQLLQ